MDRLASCYFCGAALDQSLSEYALGDESGPGVVLCEGCYEKLETVLERLRESEVDVETGGAEEPTSGTTATGDAGTGAATGRGDTSRGSAGGVDGAADGHDASESDPLGDADDVLADTGPGKDDATGSPQSDTSATSADADDSGASEGDEADDGIAWHERAAAGGDDLTGPSGGGATEESSSSGDLGVSDNLNSTTSGASTGGGSSSMTTAEFNRVIRMLQNREFPVDRHDFETVAANAYGLRPEQVGKILDLAVDRGILTEDEGELYEAE